MKNYPKRHTVRFFRIEERKQTIGEDVNLTTVKVYLKYSKSGTVAGIDYDDLYEGIDIRAYVRQLSAEERFSAMAIQDDSSIEVVINKRPGITHDLYMEFQDKTYQVGAIDNFTFEDTELKFRVKEVIPPLFDSTEYRGF